MDFKNLEQRMAQTFIDMFPPFVPDEQAPVSVSEQKMFYDLMGNLYRLALDEPLLFVASLHEDDAYPTWSTLSAYGKPDLQKNMKKFLKAMDMVTENMFLFGQNSAGKFSKSQQVVLSKLGINDFTKPPKAWTWMSTRPDANIIAFSHCLYKKDYPYTSDIYARLLGEKAFRKLENWMLGQGYKRFDINNVVASDCKLSLTYANPLWGNDTPNGGYEYKVRHTGIAAKYEPVRQQPAIFGLRIPNGLKPFLSVFDSMDKKLQKFMVSRTKKCDGCKYCVQTDKTGSRPLAFIPIDYEGQKYHFCPYFPGWRYSWTNIDNDLADQLIEALAFMDKFVPDGVHGKKVSK